MGTEEDHPHNRSSISSIEQEADEEGFGISDDEEVQTNPQLKKSNHNNLNI